MLKGEVEETIRSFFNDDLIKFFEKEEIYHIECTGEALLLFKFLRLARTEEISRMLEYSEALLERIEPTVV
ncbi:MAG: hypothetical protein GYB31_10140 [Bacteroidetes bacterium]|nr:hypothetical protein [Bacteroidota bacterium]